LRIAWVDHVARRARSNNSPGHDGTRDGTDSEAGPSPAPSPASLSGGISCSREQCHCECCSHEKTGERLVHQRLHGERRARTALRIGTGLDRSDRALIAITSSNSRNIGQKIWLKVVYRVATSPLSRVAVGFEFGNSPQHLTPITEKDAQLLVFASRLRDRSLADQAVYRSRRPPLIRHALAGGSCREAIRHFDMQG
jgi:hypothetical protein